KYYKHGLYNYILVTFEDGTEFESGSYVGGFILNIDGVDHALRGFNLYRSDNSLRIRIDEPYEQFLRDLLDNAEDITIRYERQVYVSASASVNVFYNELLPDFDEIEVTVVE